MQMVYRRTKECGILREMGRCGGNSTAINPLSKYHPVLSISPHHVPYLSPILLHTFYHQEIEKYQNQTVCHLSIRLCASWV